MANYTKKECKSRFHHDWSIEDSVLHYFGCLEFKEREKFFDKLELTDKLRGAILEEESRIRRLRDVFEKEGPTTPNGKLLSSFKIALSHRFPTSGRRSLPPPPSTSNVQSPAIGPPNGAEESRVEMLDIEDLNANVIYFKNSMPYDHPEFPGTFPNQKIPLSRLLENKDDNPLMWACEEDMIRYFHIPANNMSWVEEVIARYCKEAKKPDLDGPYLKPKRGDPESKARMLLRPQFWRGLQHGNRKDLPTHTRHMRPRCSVISTNHRKTEPKPRNIALFMPYLHWETDRRRVRAADVVKQKTNAQWSAFDDVVDATARTTILGTIDRVTSDGLLQQIPTRMVGPNRRKSITSRITNSSVQGQKLLGRVLLLAAALYESMDAYTDEKLIQKYLTATPPLHPRRTLDQSYYWTLKDTRKRDRDQVVYRGTAPNPKLMHHECFKTKEQIEKKTCCSQCLEDVTKVPRVIMVDQLWMWVLDGNTIITSFPKRWGRNKPDPSAVQKCIRTRLRAARDDEVRSVYDLAVIIIDQCSRVFFDRTQSVDLQPQVMDNFANAIGRVSHKQTIAFDHFWEYTKITSKRYNAQEEGEPETRSVQKMQKTLLDINPEGDLLREIKDIMDELFIMTQIKLQEEHVAKSFVKHVKHILQPGSFSNGENNFRNRSDVSLPELKGKRPSVTIDQQHRGSLTASLSSPLLASPTDPFDRIDHTGSEDNDWTMSLAADLLDSIANQLLELGYLKEAAENTSAALKDLLELKQQQAGVVEAREAVKQGEESLRQGRSIMLFTIVTITFLPLSFFTGIFGMNATELTGAEGDYKFKNIFVYMIPISFVVITCSLFLAFSKLVRALLSFGFNYTWALLITRTSAYVRWHDTHMNSKTLKEREKTMINDMKVKALRDELNRKIKEQQRQAALIVQQEQARDPTSVLGQVDRTRRSKARSNGAIELGSRVSGAGGNRPT